MASKFSKFLTFTAIIGAATAVGMAIYKKNKSEDFFDDDFDDFDDVVEFDDEFLDLDTEDRGYTSIGNTTSSDVEEDEDADLSDSLTSEEKEALSESINSDIEDEEDKDLFKSSDL